MKKLNPEIQPHYGIAPKRNQLMRFEFQMMVKQSYQSTKMQDGTSQKTALFRNKLITEGTVTSAIVAIANTLVHNVPQLWHRPKHVIII
jgi:hypothetical protein